MKQKNGFTLIEILVVIAIVSILTTIVLAAIKDAKDKAIDRSIESNMLTIRNQAQLYFDGAGSGSYAPAQIPPFADNCSFGLYGDPVITKTIERMELDRGPGNIECFSSAKTFAIVARLKYKDDFYCMDSVSFGKIINSEIAYLGLSTEGPGAAVDTNTALCN